MSAEYESDPGWQYLRRSREQQIKDESMPFDAKKDCWVPDKEEGYVAATIKKVKGDQVTVVVGGSEKTIKKELIQEMNPPKFEKTEDMSNLTHLNDASVLHNLRARYSSMLIYTYSGLFCVVINPYKRLPIYTDSVATMFMGKRRAEMPPHLFAVSDEAYRNMLQNHENQSMLITGESGAGKTENTKKVIAYFAMVGASQQAQTVVEKPGKKKVTLEDQIIQTNPVLEAFGNAKTVRNNNSSRFGKFIRIHFSKQGRVASCDIEHYLLEKSRVIRQAPGERCYHIFYQMYSDYKPELKVQLLLDRPLKEYWFVAQAELTIDGTNDMEEFQMTDEAFDTLHFSEEEKMNCYRLMAGHMHMGNMKFKQRPREEQAEADGTDEAEKASKMFGVDTEEFLKALMRPRVKVGAEWVNKGQNVDQVNWAVGAMGKAVYARVFTWLVKKCNVTLDQKGTPRDFFIGVLDIAGFEIFDFNSFEQLWINFVNEKLQQFFNHHMFVLEQEEYAREGIEWTFIDFGLDLQACIELIEKPLGIISMLDEECIVPKATDLTLAEKLNEQHLGKHPNFEKPKPPKGKQSEAHFAMRHYAGTVRYNVTNWLEKNKDPLNDTVVSVMKGSNDNDLLKEIWADYVTQEEQAAGARSKKKGKSGSFMTVSMMYRESLNNLMNMLRSTHPHFIRCIIPNEKKKSGLIDAALVLNQLTCNGVLEGIRICRKGFPNRMLHGDFRDRYALLYATEAKSNPDVKVCATVMLSKMVEDGSLKEELFRIGITKVFFKAGVVAHMENLRDERLSFLITGLQARIRTFCQEIDLKKRRDEVAATLTVQTNVRNWCMLRTWDWFKLYCKVKPMLRAGKVEEELEQLQNKMKDLEETLSKGNDERKILEEKLAKAAEEKQELLSQLENAKSGSSLIENRLTALTEDKNNLEKQLADLQQQLSEQEDKTEMVNREKKGVQKEVEDLKRVLQEVELNLKKSEAENQGKHNQIRSLQDEMSQQDENIARLTKEKKAQDEANSKLMDDLQSQQDRNATLTRQKEKLESVMDELEETIEREKKARADVDRDRRKAEGELRLLQENLDEVTKQKKNLENLMKKREAEQHALSVQVGEGEGLIQKLQRQVKEDSVRIQELEDEVENERQSRAKAERARADVQHELEEVNEQLEEQGGATAIQIELNKKREALLAKLRKDLEDANMNSEMAIAALKKKNSEVTAELSDQLESIQKQRMRSEKEKSELQRQLDELHASLDVELKTRIEQERLAKTYEVQNAELQIKCDEQARQLQEFVTLKSRMHKQNDDLARQIEDLEAQLKSVGHIKTQYASQLEEAKKTITEETRERQTLAAANKNLEVGVQQLKDSLEEEVAGKMEILRQLSKANCEIQQWQAKFETEGLVGVEEIEEVKKKLIEKINAIQEALDAANAKIVTLEKMKSRLFAELEDARSEADRYATLNAQIEKKLKTTEKTTEEWRRKNDDLKNELDNAQREARNATNELFKLQSTIESLNEQVENLRRENKTVCQELKDLQDQLGQGGRSVHELQKMIHRLEMEKEDLQRSLDEAEAALETEEGKVARSQLETAQIRSEIEKRIQEKEEEFTVTKANHQRALESMQATVEAESRARAELLRIKKKLESDINELETALDHANRANTDAQKNIKKYIEQVKELQLQISDEQSTKQQLNEQFTLTEKRLAVIQAEKDEVIINNLQLEKMNKQQEVEINEAREQIAQLVAQNAANVAAKKKTEADVLVLKNELEETVGELNASDERMKHASMDVARLAEELAQEHERSQNLEKSKKALDLVVKELQAKLDDSEVALLKGEQKTICKFEQRLKTVQSQLNDEQRRSQENMKTLTRQNRQIRELQFEVAEDKSNAARLNELIEKLQSKIKIQKKQIEEAEEVANVNLQKYKQLQVALEHAEERAQNAENSLLHLRSKNRMTTSLSREKSEVMINGES